MHKLYIELKYNFQEDCINLLVLSSFACWVEAEYNYGVKAGNYCGSTMTAFNNANSTALEIYFEDKHKDV